MTLSNELKSIFDAGENEKNQIQVKMQVSWQMKI